MIDSVNVALHKPVLVDSVLRASTTADKVVDGDHLHDSSRWLSKPDQPHHWLIVDLQGYFSISRVQVYAGHKSGTHLGLCSHTISVWTGNPSASMATAATSVTGWTIVSWHGKETTSMEHLDFTIVTARLVRLSIDQTTCGVNNYARVYEIEIFGRPETIPLSNQQINVALHKPTLADSVTGSYVAEKAVDGDSASISSRWLSKTTSPHHWLIVDLQQYYTITRVQICAGANARGTYGLCSHTISGWTGNPIVDMVTASKSTTGWSVLSHHGAQIVKKEHLHLSPTVVRLVRLSVDQTSCSVDNYARIFEMKIFGTVALAPAAAQRGNVALHKPVLADSVSGGYDAAKAVDGDSTHVKSRWLSRSSSPRHWMIVDLKQYYTINKMTMYGGAGGKFYGICSHSLSGWTGRQGVNLTTVAHSSTSWTQIVSHGQDTTKIEHLGFTPITVRFVRLDIDQSKCRVKMDRRCNVASCNNYARIFELEIYGDPAPTPVAGKDTNVALHKPVLADSTFGPSKGSCGALDGS
eukprot:COSAG01_NODE_771_length_13718_cov_54.441442_17_plen_523_part_01